MIDADALHDVVDVVAELGERAAGPAPVLALALGQGLRHVDVAARLAVLVLERAHPLIGVPADEIGHEGHHDDPAILRDAVEHVVRHVAGVIGERSRVRVREDDRRLRDVEHLTHDIGAHMGEIDHHAEPVQLRDHRPAEGGEAVMARLVGRRIHPIERLVVAKRHQARARRMPHAKRRKAVLQSDAALDGEEGRDLALPLGLADIGGGERAHEDIGMRVVKLMDGVDQLEDGARRLLRRRGDDRPPRFAR